jgi:DNA-binding Lrp family transcriptional regulator
MVGDHLEPVLAVGFDELPQIVEELGDLAVPQLAGSSCESFKRSLGGPDFRLPVYHKAFVLIKVDPGHEKKVVEDLMKIREVQEAHIIPGEWDILAVVSTTKEVVVPSDQKVYNLVMDRITKIKHVQDTNTMVSQYSVSK